MTKIVDGKSHSIIFFSFWKPNYDSGLNDSFCTDSFKCLTNKLLLTLTFFVFCVLSIVCYLLAVYIHDVPGQIIAFSYTGYNIWTQYLDLTMIIYESFDGNFKCRAKFYNTKCRVFWYCFFLLSLHIFSKFSLGND